MPNPIKVYNKGIRPAVYKRDRISTEAIHPGKFKTFNAKVGNSIIEKFKDACSEEDYEKHLKEVAKKQKDDQKKTENEAKKKAKAKAEV